MLHTQADRKTVKGISETQRERKRERDLVVGASVFSRERERFSGGGFCGVFSRERQRDLYELGVMTRDSLCS